MSIDPEQGRVAHVNYVPPSIKAKGLDAREWAVKVSDIVGGKVSMDVCYKTPALILFHRLVVRTRALKAWVPTLTR